jgi:hypothetical protein
MSVWVKTCPAMTKKRKVDDARRPTTANAIRAKIGEGLERILKPKKIFAKKVGRREQRRAKRVSLARRAYLPPSPSAPLPRVGPPCAGLFLRLQVHDLL